MYVLYAAERSSSVGWASASARTAIRVEADEPKLREDSQQPSRQRAERRAIRRNGAVSSPRRNPPPGPQGR